LRLHQRRFRGGEAPVVGHRLLQHRVELLRMEQRPPVGGDLVAGLEPLLGLGRVGDREFYSSCRVAIVLGRRRRREVWADGTGAERGRKAKDGGRLSWQTSPCQISKELVHRSSRR